MGLFKSLLGKTDEDADTQQEEREELSEQEIVDRLIEYMSTQDKVALVNRVERGELTKEVFREQVLAWLNTTYVLDEDTALWIYDTYSKFLWGYYRIDELIEDKDISDIRLLGPDSVFYKKKGKRFLSDIHFADKRDYERFINRIIIKNKINAGNQNAIQPFMDKSNPDWRMRFNLSTDFVMATGYAMVHIRKHPTHKKLFPDLINDGLLNTEVVGIIKQKICAGESFLLCGASGSGKTTVLNAMIEEIPKSKAIFCVQEEEELFTNENREFCSYIIREAKGEGKVNYSLDVIATNGLLVDTDVYMIGEIKGKEARDFFTAAYTGAQCLGSLHANSARDAFKRLADLIKRTTDYTTSEIEYMLRTLKNVVYFNKEKYEVEEFVEVVWDEKKNTLDFQTIFSRKGA